MKKMKFMLFATFAISLLLSSCTKDTDPEPEPTPIPVVPVVVDNAIKDASGNVYTTVTIGTQVWLKENLRTTKYNNGDAIKEDKNVSWLTMQEGYYCTIPGTIPVEYGKLYNGFVAVDKRGIAPKGFHVATKADWEALITGLGGNTVAGNRLKEKGADHWNSSNGAANGSGFTALGTGYRSASPPGDFVKLGEVSYFWTGTDGVAFTLYSEKTLVDMFTLSSVYGFSIRCVKD
jgi:uncharacterized protein (TIGR02145 family)